MVEAPDGVAALAVLKTVKADLVILDIMMPNMDARDLCRMLRMLVTVPLLMLTAEGTHPR